jgi:isopenicillin N synthase-like dioxygenase
MSPTEVQVIDLRECSTPASLAQAISESLSTAGFLFIQGHGMERQVEELFEISGESVLDSSDAETA